MDATSMTVRSAMSPLVSALSNASRTRHILLYHRFTRSWHLAMNQSLKVANHKRPLGFSSSKLPENFARNPMEKFASFSVVCLIGMRGSDEAFCLEDKYIRSRTHFRERNVRIENEPSKCVHRISCSFIPALIMVSHFAHPSTSRSVKDDRKRRIDF